MPEGIVPELLIVLFLVAAIVLTVVLSRRRPPPSAPSRPPEERVEPDAVSAAERPVEAPRRSLRDRLGKSRKFIAARLTEALGGGVSQDTWDDLEAVLVQADVGVDPATSIVGRVRDRALETNARSAEEIRALVAEELIGMLDADTERGLIFANDGPTVWLVVGVNGSGKTTTIGKLAGDLTARRRSVALAASDTFRAAADEQLATWAERAGASVVSHQPGADPGAVAFDAYQHARARGIDVLLVDTAGRLHTKTPLMDELTKVRRVIEKEGEVHECLLVIDATTGQNGLAQAREFAEATGVTGIALAKLDGTAKGGIAVAIEHTLGIPIKVIGVGEGIEDLEPFEPKNFVDALLS